ncbi:MAG: hypothetical protein CM1200mP2_39190 [Planctomycetaceae bacterium]|nr:MAG: hypothetical protein CM1200mP2_39190 [Planctomycetaceae bacterium]
MQLPAGGLGHRNNGAEDLSEGLTQHPLRDWGQFYLGDALVQQKKFTEARAIYRSSLAEFPKGSLVNEIRFGLGVCCERGQTTKPERSTTAWPPTKPPGTPTRRSLSSDHSNSIRAVRRSRRRLERLARTYPRAGGSRGTLNAGYAHFQLKQYAEAITSFQSARLRSDQAAEADYWRGVSLKALDRTDEAIKAFGQAETGKPGTDLARDIQFQWADPQFRAGRYSQAAPLFSKRRHAVAQAPRSRPGLLFATESMLLATENLSEPAPRQRALDQVQKLIDRFEREYPRSQLRHGTVCGPGRVESGSRGEHQPQGRPDTLSHRDRTGRVGDNPQPCPVPAGPSRQPTGNDRMVLDTLRPILARSRTRTDPANSTTRWCWRLRVSWPANSTSRQPNLREVPQETPPGPLSPDALAVLAESKQRRGWPARISL